MLHILLPIFEQFSKKNISNIPLSNIPSNFETKKLCLLKDIQFVYLDKKIKYIPTNQMNNTL